MRSSSHAIEAGLMLPDAGTGERARLEAEALALGLQALREEYGHIPNALYRVYQHYRLQFTEREPLGSPCSGQRLAEALTDARELEVFVCSSWVERIRAREERE